jgi:hypothetical protein
MNNILIIFPSWEERSVLGFQRDIEKYPNLNKIFLFVFENSAHPTETGKSVSDIKQICTVQSIDMEEIIIPNFAVDQWRKLNDFVQNIDGNSNIHIDITTMPRCIIWTLLFFFRQQSEQIAIIYHKAQQYDKVWISKDPDVPQLLFKHSGIIEFGKPTTLLILTGYDENRVIQLINFYEPYNTEIGKCNPRTDFDYGITKENIFDVPQYDDTWGYDIIESKIKQLLETSNLIIASLGPKTGAISVYQCFMKYPQIALAYVPAKEFNIAYCSGIGETLTKEIYFKL